MLHGFAKKKFFASKRNEAKRDPFRMRFARSREKNFFFASFRFEYVASDQSEINRAYIFALFRFQKFCFSLLFRFVFASFHFRFALDAKTSDKTFFSHQSEQISLPFRFEAKMMAVFRFRFASKRK
jgi:hypothetical protein